MRSAEVNSTGQPLAYQVTVADNGVNRTLTYDRDGAITNNGAGQAYNFDAENRLTKITYADSTSTEITYNGLGQWVKIDEKNSAGTVTSEKNFVWCPGDEQPCEERDGSNNVTKRFYSWGEQIGGTNYFFTRDTLGSVVEMTDSSGVIHARYSYTPWGVRTKVSGDLDADFGFDGMYFHAPSGLYLTWHRPYDPILARFISRDPIGETGGINLYGFTGNDPINATDSSGLFSSILTADGMAAFVALTSEEQAGLATSGLIVGGVKALLDRAKPLPTQTEGSCPVNLPTQTTTTVSQPTVPQEHFPTENPSIPQEQLTPTDVPLPLIVNSKEKKPFNEARRLSDNELKQLVGDVHGAKRDILRDFGGQLKGDKNFDILVDKQGNMVLKGNQSGTLVPTDLPPSAYSK